MSVGSSFLTLTSDTIRNDVNDGVTFPNSAFLTLTSSGMQSSVGDVVLASPDTLNLSYEGIRAASSILQVYPANGMEGFNVTGEVDGYADPPTSPVDLSLAIQHQAVTVTWNAPANDGGAPLTGYVIRVYTVSESIHELVKTVQLSASSTTALMDGLTNLTLYEFRVVATNKVGESPHASGQVSPANVPDAPTTVSAVENNQSIELTWQPPAFDGGSALTGYVIRVYAVSDLTSVLKTENVSLSNTSSLVTGLVNATLYVFRVFAKNIVGESATYGSVEASPMTVPDAPTDVSTVLKHQAIQLSWNAPSFNGGSALTGYVIRAYAVSDLSVLVKTVNTLSTTALIDGLTLFTRYEFRVVAKNMIGESATYASLQESVAALPFPPSSMSLTVGDQSLTVNWSDAAGDGGTPITGYVIRVHLPNVSSFAYGTISVDASTRSYVIDGLANSIQLEIRVFSQNIIGESVQYVSDQATPATVPDAPTNLSTISRNGIVDLLWTAPENNGGSALTGYVVRVYDASDLSVLVKTLNVIVGAAGTSVSGLTNSTLYEFRVFATNSRGESAYASIQGTPGTPPEPPSPLLTEKRLDAVELTWTEPADNGGFAITGYVVRVYAVSDLTTVLQTVNVDASSTTTLIEGLTHSTLYEFHVVATNDLGEGGYAVAQESPATYPGVPTSLSAVPQDLAVELTWVAPTFDGGLPVEEYVVDVYTYSSGLTTVLYSLNVMLTTTLISSLPNDDTYQFRVFAKNTLGLVSTTYASIDAAPTPPEPVPSLPALEIALLRVDDKIYLAWQAPDENSGVYFQEYVIKVYNMANLTTPVVETTAAYNAVSLEIPYTNWGNDTFEFRLFVPTLQGPSIEESILSNVNVSSL